MADWYAWQYDAIRRLQDCIDGCVEAQGDLHNDEPPWPDVDALIQNAVASLHVCRVHVLAARAAYHKATHAATVAKNYDVEHQGDDEQLLGPDSPVSGEL